MKSFIIKQIYFFIFIVFSLNISNIYSQIKDQWRVNLEQSDQYLVKKDYKNALDLAEKSIVEIRKTMGNNTETEFTILGKIGKIYYLSGNYEKAIEYYTKEKELISELKGKNSAPYARAINNISVIYQTIGKNELVEDFLIESVSIKKEILGENDTSYAKSLNNLAQFYVNEGRFPEAEFLFTQSLDIKKKFLKDDDPSYALTLVNLGLLYKRIGDNQKAKVLLEEAYNTIKNTMKEDEPEYINTLFNLSILYMQTGENEKAIPLIEKTKNIEKLLSKDLKITTANNLYNLAQLKIGIKQNKEAQLILEDLSLNFKNKFGNSHPLYVQIIRTLGVSYWIDEKYNLALEKLQEAIQLTKLIYDESNVNYAVALHNYAGLLKEMKEYESAEEYYRKSFEVYKLQIDKYFPYYSESEKAKFYLDLKEKFEMFNCFIVQRYTDNPNISTEMYDFQLSTKGVLLDYSKKLRNSIYSSNNQQNIDKYNNWISNKEYLVKLYNMSKGELKQTKADVDSLDFFVNKLEKELSLISSQNSQQTTEITWRDIQKKLKPNEAAIEIVRFKFFNKGWQDSTYYAALILTSETINFPVLILIKKGNELDNTYLKNYKNLIKSKFPDKKSYSVYWQEIDEFVKDKEVLYISLDGVYNNINVSTLQRSDGSFVIDNKNIIILSNTKELLDLTNKSNKINSSPTALLLGAPKFDINKDYEFKVKKYVNKDDLLKEENPNKIEISELPATKKEISIINELLTSKNWKTKELIGVNASEVNLKKMNHPNLIHIATHGYFFTGLNDNSKERVFGVDVEKAAQNPLLRSGLLLAGASNSVNFDLNQADTVENGVMTAYETMNLDLSDNNLTVLSACETGLGEVMNGEGVYGLQRAFLIAGAKSLIMSLWTVDDKATQELMTTFYDYWLSGEKIGVAFRNAQLKIKEKYKEPYYWGAFILLGEVN